MQFRKSSTIFNGVINAFSNEINFVTDILPHLNFSKKENIVS